MAVAVSATGTATRNAGATTQTYTFTVNNGDTLAMFFIVQENANGSTVTSATWDSGGTNQACTQVASSVCSTPSDGSVSLWAVVNPTPGTKTLSVVQGLADVMIAEMQTYTGTVTSSVASACINAQTTANSNQNSSLPAIAGTTGDMAVGAFVSIGTISSINNTSIWLLTTNRNNGGSRAANAGSSITFTCAQTAAVINAGAGCDIVAAAAAPFIPIDYSDGAVALPRFAPPAQPYNTCLYLPVVYYPRAPVFTTPRSRIAPLDPSGFNLALMTGVTAAPFAQFDWSPARTLLRPQPDGTKALNPNLFTNPIPFGPYDYSLGPFAVSRYRPSDPTQPLNPNLFTNPIPFGPYDYSQGPLALFRSRAPDQVYPRVAALFAQPFPFAPPEFGKSLPMPPRAPDGTQQLNPNLFTNPIPFGPFDWSKPTFQPPRAPDQALYNQSLYQVIVVTAPFLPIDYSKPFFPRPLAVDPQPGGLNLQLFTNPVPFGPYDYNKPFNIPPVRPIPTADPLNINLYTNPIPFAQYDWSKPFAIPPVPPQATPTNMSIYFTFVTPPFAQYDWSKPAAPILAKPLVLPLNLNLFTNPIPFGPYDYSRGPTRVPSAPRDYSQSLNPLLFTNPVPFAQFDWSKPVPIGPRPRDFFPPNLVIRGGGVAQPLKVHANYFFVSIGLRPL